MKSFVKVVEMVEGVVGLLLSVSARKAERAVTADNIRRLIKAGA